MLSWTILSWDMHALYATTDKWNLIAGLHLNTPSSGNKPCRAEVYDLDEIQRNI